MLRSPPRPSGGSSAADLEGHFSGHSLRVGSTQSLASQGASLVEMQNAGRWQSPAMPGHYARGEFAARVGRWGPTGFMGWDSIRQTYAVHMENCRHQRCPLGKRLIGRAESPDMIQWSQPETIILPDEQDYPDVEFYYMPVIVYEGMYVGMLWNFRTTKTTILPQAVFSRDGIHYNRDYRQPFIPPGPNGSFDSAVVYSQSLVVHQGRLLNYYTGVNWRSPESLLTLGDEALASVGLAVTEPDGFVSLDGVQGHERQRVAFSEMVTRSFTFSGDRLFGCPWLRRRPCCEHPRRPIHGGTLNRNPNHPDLTAVRA